MSRVQTILDQLKETFISWGDDDFGGSFDESSFKVTFEDENTIVGWFDFEEAGWNPVFAVFDGETLENLFVVDTNDESQVCK